MTAIAAPDPTCRHEAAHLAAAVMLGLEPREARADEVVVRGADLRAFAIVGLAGGIHEGLVNWPPMWPPSLAATALDERHVADVVQRLHLGAAAYQALVAEAYELCGSSRFEKLAGRIAAEIEEHQALGAEALRAIAAEEDTVNEDEFEDTFKTDAELDEAKAFGRAFGDQIRVCMGAAPAASAGAKASIARAPIKVARFGCDAADGPHVA